MSDSTSPSELPSQSGTLAPQQRTSRPAGPVVTGVVGVLVGAALVGLLWLIAGGGPGSGKGGPFGSGGSGGPGISAPGTLGGFMRQEKAMKDLGAKGSDERAAQVTTAEEHSTRSLSEAYGGAPAVVQGFADAGVEQMFTLAAVRAASPRPYVPFEDAALLGLAVPTDQLLTIGNVDCVLYNQPTPAGQQPKPETVVVNYCQRAGAGLTVQIRQVGGDDLRQHPDRVAALVDQAWSAVS
ncbi:hypothetical protein [Kitasatospora sp. GP82]|uniref:hypothetical protein n=1 Tax=Kitasatospora sp. GP82 TaxID=3035089 RepID=UPI002474A7B8|nr:hypothetical protein [Kitasatospora sp. GP82]MDH6126489.1 hypothetical protein [Kitasatospora sp. GP82]